MENCAKLITALNKAMKQVGFVKKTGVNKFHNYSYASAEDLVRAIHPAMVDNGLVLLPTTPEQPTTDTEGNTRLLMESTLAHISGEVWPYPFRIWGCGNDKAKNGTIGDKGEPKAYTGAQKATLRLLFVVETGDDEPERPNDQEQMTPEDIEKTAAAREAADLKAVRTKFAKVVKEHGLDKELVKRKVSDMKQQDFKNLPAKELLNIPEMIDLNPDEWRERESVEA